MNILVLGATGFVGSWITTHLLQQEGLNIYCATRHTKAAHLKFPDANIIYCDFLKDTSPADWLPRLQHIHIIINCVGIFHADNTTMWNIHYHTPRALFDAAQELNIAKIIHLSALNVENYSTEYGKSKHALETYLNREYKGQYFILKPSFIYGPGATGGISLLTALAALPITPLPGKAEQPFQPIHIDDLSQTILHCIKTENKKSQCFAVVSTPVINIKEIISTLKDWLGQTYKRCFKLPIIVLRTFTPLGKIIGSTFLNKNAITMLLQGNTSQPQDSQFFREQTGITPMSFEAGMNSFPSSEKDRWYAKLFFAPSLLRISLAMMWFFSVATSLFFNKSFSYQLLTEIGLPLAQQSIYLYIAGVINFLIGLGLLINYKIKLNCLFQAAIILIYTIIITLFLPRFWLEPFGPIIKNIPILVAILMLYLMES